MPAILKTSLAAQLFQFTRPLLLHFKVLMKEHVVLQANQKDLYIRASEIQQFVH